MMEEGQVLYNKYGDIVTIKEIKNDVAEGIVEHVPVYASGYGGVVKGSVQYNPVQIYSHEIGTMYFYDKKDVGNWDYLLSANSPYAENLKYIQRFFEKETEEAKEYIPYGPYMNPEKKQEIIVLYYDEESQYVEEECFHKEHEHCFGRIDFDTELRLGHETKYFRAHYHDMVYISKGRYQRIGEKQIVNWRSEIAGMYYDQASLIRKSPHYLEAFSPKTVNDVPGIEYEYHLMLKRSFSDNPFSYRDMYICATSTEESQDKSKSGNSENSMSISAKARLYEEGSIDPFLLKVIEEKRLSNQLTDIIATIQSNQNEIIRHARKKNMIIQGCAGSGKTMILLHRISYLKYNDYLRNLSRGIIIVPSRNFNIFVHHLSEDLEIDKMPRMTMFQYYLNTCISYQEKMEIDVNKRSNTLLGRFDAIKQLPYVSMNDTSYVDVFDNDFENELATFYSAFMDSFFKEIEEAQIIGIAERLGLNVETNISCSRKLNCLYSMVNYEIENEYSSKEDSAKKIVREMGISLEERYDFIEQLNKLKDELGVLEELEGNIALSSYKDVCKRLKEVQKEKLLLVSAQEREKELRQIIEKSRRGLRRFFSNTNKALIEELHTLITTINSIRNTDDILFNEQIFGNVEKGCQSVETVIAYIKKILQQRQRSGRGLKQLCEKIEKCVSDIELSDVSIKEGIRNIESLLQMIYDDVDFKESVERLKQAEENLRVVQALALSADERRIIKYAREMLVKRHKIVFDIYEAYSGHSIENIIDGMRLFSLLTFYCLHCGTLESKYDYFFVDEGQDYSEIEYRLLARIHDNRCVFEVYGDYLQRVTVNRGLDNWKMLEDLFDADYYEIKENYRNTVEVAEYVNNNIMDVFRSIGFHGKDVEYIFEPNIKMLCEEIQKKRKENCLKEVVVICKDRKIFGDMHIRDIVYWTDMDDTYSVVESKGLEFEIVYVIDNDMSPSEKYISFSRALEELYVIHLRRC